MKPSLFRRLYRAVFLVSLVIMLLSLSAVEFFDEDLEDRILNQELTGELNYFKNRIDSAEYQNWRTDRLNVVFLPQDHPESILPSYLQGLPAPYSGEIESGEETYLIRTEPVTKPSGRLILAKDISIMESQETLTQLTLLGIALFVALIGFIFSRVVAARLVNPLRALTHDIQAIEPGKSMGRIQAEFDDLEFDEIAKAFNRFLDALEMFIHREKSFVKLASHELRTPIAVMTGALDVIETREDLSEPDQRTLARIRRAALDMQQDVEVLLALARGDFGEQPDRVSLYQSIRDTIEDLQSIRPEYAARLQLSSAKERDLVIDADQSLIRMLVRNLLQNAFRHTDAAVEIWISADGFGVRDYGAGLPDAVHARLTKPLNEQPGAFQEPSFGLLIVQLICEKLDAKLTIREPQEQGTEILIAFS